MKHVVATLFLLALLPLPEARAQPRDVVLLRAHVLKVTPIPHTGHPPEPGKVFLGADATVAVGPPEFLIGHVRPVATLVLRMSAIPDVDKADDIYVLASASGQDGLKVVGWSYVSQGVCLGSELARQLGIEQQLTELRRSGRAVCPP